MEQSASATVSQKHVEALLFELADHRFAFPLTDIDEIARACALQALPKAPRPVCGALNLRGEIVPVLDLRMRFDLPEKALEPSDYFVIARVGSRRAALKVDAVVGLETVSMTPLAEAPHLPPTLAYVSGVAAVAGGVVLIYDVAKFLSQTESEALDGAIAARALEGMS